MHIQVHVHVLYIIYTYCTLDAAHTQRLVSSANSAAYRHLFAMKQDMDHANNERQYSQCVSYIQPVCELYTNYRTYIGEGEVVG